MSDDLTALRQELQELKSATSLSLKNILDRIEDQQATLHVLVTRPVQHTPAWVVLLAAAPTMVLALATLILALSH